MILGDGYDPTTELEHPAKILGRSLAYPLSLTERERKRIWRRYEYIRIKTSNQFPNPLLYYLIRLAGQGILSNVITTNYDSYWPSIRARDASSGVNILINPITGGGSSTDHYYEESPGPSAIPILIVYMIHGRLDFVTFDCQYRTNLPNVVTDFYHPSFAKAWSYVVPIRHWCNPGADPCVKNDSWRHDVDWLDNDNRVRYKDEIQAAFNSLEDESTTAGILIMGFSGYYGDMDPDSRRNEELVPILERIIDRGKIPVWAAHTERQWTSMVSKGWDQYLSGRNEGKSSFQVFRLPKGQELSVWLMKYLEVNTRTIGFYPNGWKNNHMWEWEDQRKFVHRDVFRVTA